jgi:hypothetical protein
MAVIGEGGSDQGQGPGGVAIADEPPGLDSFISSLRDLVATALERPALLAPYNRDLRKAWEQVEPRLTSIQRELAVVPRGTVRTRLLRHPAPRLSLEVAVPEVEDTALSLEVAVPEVEDTAKESKGMLIGRGTRRRESLRRASGGRSSSATRFSRASAPPYPVWPSPRPLSTSSREPSKQSRVPTVRASSTPSEHAR